MTRTGGEEFVIVMKGAPVGDAFLLTERLLRMIADVRFERLPADFAVTCSSALPNYMSAKGFWVPSDAPTRPSMPPSVPAAIAPLTKQCNYQALPHSASERVAGVFKDEGQQLFD